MKGTVTPLLLFLAAACSTSPASTTTVTSTPPAAPISAPTAEEPSKSEAIDRADRLIEELRQREAAQAKQDRENPLPPPPRLEDVLRSMPAPTPAAATATSVTTSAAMAPSTGAPIAAPVAANVRDEQWWKNEMRALQLRLEENLRKFDAAMSAWKSAINQMDTKSVTIFATAQEAANRSQREAEQLKAIVQNDRNAIERLREDARRASVPPGWLRWP